VLVTGGAGFIGCNLANRLAQEGHDVLIYDSLSRPGVADNLAWLQQTHPRRVSAMIADIRDATAVVEAVRNAAAVFHLAAQVAVTTSIDAPQDDFEINLRGTFTLLEALRRRADHVPLIFASTNKVYGDLADVALELCGDAYRPVDPELRDNGLDERRPLDFHTPYGCSKGAADQYVLEYARTFSIPTAVMRMSCIYGPHQMGTEDQGWVAHFLLCALRGEPISIYGDGCQVRDVLHVDDAVAAYLAAWRRVDKLRWRAFNLGGGPANAISLRQLIGEIGRLLDHPVQVCYGQWRQGDQRYYVSNIERARVQLGLAPALPWRDGVAALASWLGRHRIRNVAPSASDSRPVRLTGS
jgi:CDP-paratose 2-epimerase